MEIARGVCAQTGWRKAARSTTLAWSDGVPYALVALIGLALIVAGLLIGHYATFFSADSGVKYLASRSILNHGSSAAIPYPFAHFDPHGKYVLPLTAWINGQDFAGYSLPFEYLTAFCMLLFGAAGTVVPSVLGTVCILVAQVELAKLLSLNRNRWLLVLCSLISTPLIFYSLTLWEHTLGVGLFCLGLVAMLRGLQSEGGETWWTVLGGGLFCLSILMRRELIIPSVILLVAGALIFRRKPALVMSFVAACVMLFPIGLIFELNPMPLALGLTHASPGRSGIVTSGVGAAPAGHWVRLEWLTAGGWATGFFVVATIILVAIRLRKPNLLPTAAPALGILAGSAFVVQLTMHYSWSHDNPLAFSPLLVLGLWLPILMDWRDKHANAFILVWALSVVGAAGIVWMAADYGGGQWGPRYLLFVFPLCLLLVWKAGQTLLSGAGSGISRRLIIYAFVVLAGESTVLQAIGVQAIVTGNQQWAQTAAVIEARPGNIVASMGDPTVDSIPSVYGPKTVLWAASRGDFQRLMAVVRKHNLGPVTIVCGPRVRCPWNAFPHWRHGKIRRSNFVRFAGYRVDGS